jgi:transcriptional regulator with XRE-family HTH domain
VQLSEGNFVMPNYTFAELLTIYFHLQNNLEARKTQADLAAAAGVSRRTVSGWFAGDYVPRTPEVVERLAAALCLTAFQADLLFYAVDPTWVKYGTPPAVLQTAEVIRYRETAVAQSTQPRQTIPSLAQIEQDWVIVFEDTFETNYQRWGVGVKRNGMSELTRTLSDKRYRLCLQNQYHEDVFMGGDSACFAPEIYYFTVQAQLAQGASAADGWLRLDVRSAQ